MEDQAEYKKKKEQTRTVLNKKAFIDAYTKTYGNVTAAAKAVGISRGRFYEWINSDSDFKKQIADIQPEEQFIDFAENAIIKRIQAGDTTAIIFTLKSKGKKRGWVERQEVDNGKKYEINVTSAAVQDVLDQLNDDD